MKSYPFYDVPRISAGVQGAHLPLSSREARILFSWYPFTPCSSILSIGGCRASDGRTQGAGRHAEASLVFSFCQAPWDGVREMVFPTLADARSVFSQQTGEARRRFDYVIIPEADAEMFAPDALALANSLLAPKGILLLAFDNAAASRGAGSAAITKQDALAALTSAGFAAKAYYPLPDRLSPQLVFTDAYQPTAEMLHRLQFAYDGNTRHADERRAYCFDAVKSGPFSSRAPSFFFECAHPGEASFAGGVFIVPGIARKRRHKLTTTLHDDFVTKNAACPEAEDAVLALARNLDALTARGIKTLPHSMEQGRLTMPRLYDPLLQELLTSRLESDTAFCFSVLDLLQQAILASSETCPPATCTLRASFPELDFGPILQHAYVEMIPLNCFYADGDLIFFDQEFVRECCPASYVMFRALYHLRISGLPGALFNKFISRYNLAGLWDVYTAEERKFQQEVNQPTPG